MSRALRYRFNSAICSARVGGAGKLSSVIALPSPSAGRLRSDDQEFDCCCEGSV